MEPERAGKKRRLSAMGDSLSQPRNIANSLGLAATLHLVTALQMARQAVLNNLNFFASSVLSWWRREEAGSGAAGLDAAEDDSDSAPDSSAERTPGSSQQQGTPRRSLSCREGLRGRAEENSPLSSRPSQRPSNNPKNTKTLPSLPSAGCSQSRLSSGREEAAPPFQSLRSRAGSSTLGNENSRSGEAEEAAPPTTGFARGFTSWLKTRIVGSTQPTAESYSTGQGADAPVRQLRRLTVQDRISRQRSVWSRRPSQLASQQEAPLQTALEEERLDCWRDSKTVASSHSGSPSSTGKQPAAKGHFLSAAFPLHSKVVPPNMQISFWRKLSAPAGRWRPKHCEPYNSWRCVRVAVYVHRQRQCKKFARTAGL